jgi:hypothetical protein
LGWGPFLDDADEDGELLFRWPGHVDDVGRFRFHERTLAHFSAFCIHNRVLMEMGRRKMGRKRLLTIDQERAMYAMSLNDAVSYKQLGEAFGVNPRSVGGILRRVRASLAGGQ